MMFKIHFLLVIAAFFTPLEGRRATLVSSQARSNLPGRCSQNNRPGYCVQSYLCDNGKILTQGEDLLDEKTIECEAPLVCCELEEETKATTKRPKSSTLVPIIQTMPKGPGEACIAHDRSRGRCLYTHLCRNDSTAIDGSDLLDERSTDPCPEWRNTIQICCPASMLPPNIDFDEPKNTTTPKTRIGENDGEDTPCMTETGKGKCVHYYQCTDYQFDGSNQIDLRFNPPGTCSDYTICCPEERVDKNQIKPKCGRANKEGLVYKTFDRATNETKFGEFPWMVSVMTRNGLGAESYNSSGGSLIHPSVVLTAAHFVLRALDDDIIVRAGEWDTLSTGEPLQHQDRVVRKIVAHPLFNNRNKHNDIALLFLEAPFTLAPHVGVICLPPAGQRAQPSADCVANGWGKDKFGAKGTLPNILKKTILPVVEHGDCQNILRTTRLGPFFKLDQGFMCAGGSRLDTCTQDGGGPLACNLDQDPNRFTVYGVVSWGIGCGENGVPGVYADVSQYRGWVQDALQAEGIDVAEYDS